MSPFLTSGSSSQHQYFTFFFFFFLLSTKAVLSSCQCLFIPCHKPLSAFLHFHFQHHPGANPSPPPSSDHLWANPPTAPSWAESLACLDILQLEAENKSLSSAAVLGTGSCPFFTECFEILAWACKRSARCYYKEMQPHYLYTELCCLLIAPLS